MKKPVLIIQHSEHEHPAIIRRALESQNLESVLVQVFRSAKYPDQNSIAGLISLGGPMSVNDVDSHSWIQAECDLLRECILKKMPVLGICLGAQLIAKSLGNRVEKNLKPEVGWHKIELSVAGTQDKVLGGMGTSPLVYQWHNETFELPASADLLASSEVCQNQAFKIGEQVYGFQFHPEADHQLVHEWMRFAETHEEIKSYLENYGEETIHESDRQKELSVIGEESSLRITAAAVQIFRKESYQPISDELLGSLNEWMARKTQLVMVLRNSKGKEFELRGTIQLSMMLPAGQFIVFKEGNTLQWPVRVDDIVRIKTKG